MKRAIDILVVDGTGNKRKVRVHLEEEAVEFLAATYTTEAPLSFTYDDGSPVEKEVLQRIHERLFRRTTGKAGSKAEGGVRLTNLHSEAS